jgi:RsiW-degrading membrane proteinase PrsW (M82 family)
MKQLQSFILGIFGAVGALFLEIAVLSFFIPSSSTSEMVYREFSSPDYLFFLAILIEEFLKYILIVKVISKISENKSVVTNSLFLGAGFSILELLSFYWDYRNGVGLDPLAVVGIIVLHISTAVIIGYFVSKNVFPVSLLGLLASLVAHSAYNVLGIMENPHQKQFIAGLLGLLLILDVFMIIRPKIFAIKEKT